MRFIFDLFILFVFFGALASLGKRILLRCGFTFSSEGQAVLIGLGLGSVIFMFGMLGLGFFGLIRAIPLGLILGIFLILSLRDFFLWFRALCDIKLLERFNRQSAFLKVLMGITLLIGVANAIRASAPPTTDDELSYHLYGPQHYVRTGYWSPPPVTHYPNYYPQTPEMFYTAGMLFLNDSVPALTHLLFGVACALIVALIALRISGPPAALLAGIIFYTMPRLTSLTHIAYTDFVILFLSLVSLETYLQWRANYERRWIVLSSVILCAALASKFSTLSIFGAYYLLFCYESWKMKRPFFETASVLFFAGLCSVFFFLPWFIRNVIHTGNPFYPFSLLGTVGDDVFGLMLHGAKELFVDKLIKIALLPHHMATFDFSQGTGPILMLFPLAFLAPRVPALVKSFFLFVALHCVLSIVVLHDAAPFRYILMSHALLAVVAGFGLHEGLAQAPAWASRAVKALILFSMLMPNLAFAAGGAQKRLPYAIGRMSREAYLQKYYEQEGYDAVTFVNQGLPGNVKIWMIYGDCARPYYYDKNLFYCTSIKTLESGDYETIRPYIEENGVTHILFVKYFDWRKTEQGIWTLPHYFSIPWLSDGEERKNLVPIFDNGKAVVYAVNAPDKGQDRRKRP